VRFEALTLTDVKNIIFQVLTTWRLLQTYQCLRGNYFIFGAEGGGYVSFSQKAGKYF